MLVIFTKVFLIINRQVALLCNLTKCTHYNKDALKMFKTLINNFVAPEDFSIELSEYPNVFLSIHFLLTSKMYVQLLEACMQGEAEDAQLILDCYKNELSQFLHMPPGKRDYFVHFW